MVLDTSMLNTQQYKVRIKGKVEQFRERSSTLSLHFGVVAIEKGAFGSPSTTVKLYNNLHHLVYLSHMFSNEYVSESPNFFCTVINTGRNVCLSWNQRNACCALSTGLLGGKWGEIHTKYDSALRLPFLLRFLFSWKVIRLTIPFWIKGLSLVTLKVTDTNARNFSFIIYYFPSLVSENIDFKERVSEWVWARHRERERERERNWLTGLSCVSLLIHTRLFDLGDQNFLTADFDVRIPFDR